METKILIINGSANEASSNGRLIAAFAQLVKDELQIDVFGPLSLLPHFDPQKAMAFPAGLKELQQRIASADALVICTPEYIFGIPAGLKNMLEWCVGQMVLAGKPVGIITASAEGTHGHSQLKLILHTLGAVTDERAELLISGIRGKFDDAGMLIDRKLHELLACFKTGLMRLVEEHR